MKILMVSIFSQHFFNWTLQLKDSSHEIHWIDIYDSNTYVTKIDFVDQTVKWKNRFDYPGRYTIKKKFPRLYKTINRVNQRDFKKVFEKKMEELKPDLVHSFVMYAGTVPILKTMENYPDTKWAYSAWGNDLYFYKDVKEYKEDMDLVFPHLDFMFADCTRDYNIAKKLGFKGEYLGTYPTGGGYEFENTDPLILSLANKKTILIKGYEHKFGRCINIMKAIYPLKDELRNFKIIIFGASRPVFQYIEETEFKNWENLEIYGNIGRGEVLKFMGEALIYIGNSISDGMPNTLLEAILMESFPIQSNPGGATAEIIHHKKNGFLIENAEDISEIRYLFKTALNDSKLIQEAIEYNRKNVKPKLERQKIKREVQKKYTRIEETLKN